jgi:hypothetical protein
LLGSHQQDPSSFFAIPECCLVLFNTVAVGVLLEEGDLLYNLLHVLVMMQYNM